MHMKRNSYIPKYFFLKYTLLEKKNRYGKEIGKKRERERHRKKSERERPINEPFSLANTYQERTRAYARASAH